MNSRWPLWRIAAFVLAIASATGAFWLTSLVPAGFSSLVDEGNGAALAMPEQPPSDDPYGLGITDYTRSMSVTAVVDRDGSATITETIVQVFNEYRRGIYRTIPTSTDGRDQAVTELTVSTSEGTPDDVLVEDISGGISVRIGDENQQITGAHTYQLTYRIENVVSIVGDVATVSLDAITDWQQDITALDYSVIGPAAPLDRRCYIGSFTSTDRCPGSAPSDTGGRFDTGFDGLPAYSGLTVEFDYPASAFEPEPALTDRSQSTAPVGVAAGLMLAGLGTAVARSESRRRRDLTNAIAGIDETFQGPMSIDLEGRRQSATSPFPPPSANSALAVSALPPLEFVPPVNLDPASMLRMHDGVEADIRRMIASTLVDLAADGVVGMERSKKDWVLRRIEQPPRNVKSYELTLLQAILGDGNEAKLSERRDEIGDVLTTYLAQVDGHLSSLQLVGPDLPSKVSYSRPWKWPAFMSWPALFAIVAGIPGVIASTVDAQRYVVPVVGAILGLVIVGYGWFTHNTSQGFFTPRGRGASYRSRGFVRFLSDSEAIHARAAERMGVMREYMGYAVAFDAVDTWTKAMPESVRQEIGSLADPVALSALAYSPTLTGSSRSAFAPQTSGFSGGFSSGGGGFSGGGSGGGGGGSW